VRYVIVSSGIWQGFHIGLYKFNKTVSGCTGGDGVQQDILKELRSHQNYGKWKQLNNAWREGQNRLNDTAVPISNWKCGCCYTSVRANQRTGVLRASPLVTWLGVWFHNGASRGVVILINSRLNTTRPRPSLTVPSSIWRNSRLPVRLYASRRSRNRTKTPDLDY